jgi:hypothetical protein
MGWVGGVCVWGGGGSNDDHELLSNRMHFAVAAVFTWMPFRKPAAILLQTVVFPEAVPPVR